VSWFWEGPRKNGFMRLLLYRQMILSLPVTAVILGLYNAAGIRRWQ